MTFEQCHETLLSIRHKQKTLCPLIRVNYGGHVVQGRVIHSDSDRENPGHASTRFGILTLKQPGLCQGPVTVLQIANIPPDGIHELDVA